MPMKSLGTSLFVAAVLFLGSVSQGVAAEGSQAVTCPAKEKGESYVDYVQRNHDFCEVHWRDMVATNSTGGQSHDQYIRSCKRQCFASWETAGELYLLLGAGVAAGFALANEGGNNSPPPVSP
jgi:hypothetical protein